MGRLLVVLVLVAAACGGATTSSSAPVADNNTVTTSEGVGRESASGPTATATDTADPDEPTSAAATSGTTREKPDGRPAPDFVLALGEGGEFSPSSEDKPIYLVFWAEW